MTDKQMHELAESTMSIVGIVQGLYMSFLKENDGDSNVALALTDIAWNGLMGSINQQNDDKNCLM